MPLISKHSSGELDSPFYKLNKERCESYESFIHSLGGNVKGAYNAWSYEVNGIVKKKSTWNFKLKKSSYSNTGNLFLSSKYQAVLEVEEWSCDSFHVKSPRFYIRRKRYLDFIRIAFNSKWNDLPETKGYVIKCEATEIKLVSSLYKVLKKLYLNKKILQINYQESSIMIRLVSNEIYEDEIRLLLLL